MIPSLFSNLVWRARARQTRLEKREIGYGVRLPGRRSPLALARGYYLAALKETQGDAGGFGRRLGEPSASGPCRMNAAFQGARHDGRAAA